MNRLLMLGVSAGFALCLGLAGSGDALAQSSHCDPEDREVPGNEISPCKWPNPTTVTHVSYQVFPDYPVCRERIRFHGIGAADLPLKSRTEALWYMWDDRVLRKSRGAKSAFNEYIPLTNTVLENFARHVRYYSYPSPPEGEKYKYGVGYVDILTAATWRPDQLPALTRLYTTATAEVLLVLSVSPSVAGASSYHIWTNRVPAPPEMSSQLALVDACLAELELHQERLRVLQIQQEEQIRTQALVARLETLSKLAVPLREQIELRLRGAEERARITSEWLAEQEVVEAELEELTAALSVQVEEYNAISRAFLESLGKYQESIAARLRTAQAQEEAIQDEIDALRQQTAGASTPDATDS